MRALAQAHMSSGWKKEFSSKILWVRAGSRRRDKVRAVAERVLPKGHDTEGRLARWLFRHAASGDDSGGVTGEVAPVRKQPDPASCLVFDPSDFTGGVGAGQHDQRPIRRGLYGDPAFGVLIDVFDQVEPEPPQKKASPAA